MRHVSAQSLVVVDTVELGGRMVGIVGRLSAESRVVAGRQECTHD